jgi:hypothetical protein
MVRLQGVLKAETPLRRGFYVRFLDDSAWSTIARSTAKPAASWPPQPIPNGILKCVRLAVRRLDRRVEAAGSAYFRHAVFARIAKTGSRDAYLFDRLVGKRRPSRLRIQCARRLRENRP